MSARRSATLLGIHRAGAWTISIALLLVLAGPVAREAPAHNHLPPRQTLTTAGTIDRDYAIQGEWWESGSVQPCALLAIDAAPGLPAATVVGRGRHRFEVSYETPVKPRFVRVGLYGGKGENRRQGHLRAVRDRQGGVQAWIASFHARVHRALRVVPYAAFEDENGCGMEWVQSLYLLRAR